MIGTIITDDQWPDGAYMHTWDSNGLGNWHRTAYGAWHHWGSDIPMPADWDWRVPVMRHQPPSIDLEQFRCLADFVLGRSANRGNLKAAYGLLALIDGQVTLSDTHRLEWLMRNISGAELRRLNVCTAANCDREAIDDAMSVQTSKGEGE